VIRTAPLDGRVSTAGQIRADDLAGAGFRVVVNNRPDGEVFLGQPPAAKIAEAVAEAGFANH
jgi:protein tyrosine phosphatase (PTP) superfamily phosphohydrolase (DUF442 family)